jgi:hypothetical protein
MGQITPKDTTSGWTKTFHTPLSVACHVLHRYEVLAKKLSSAADGAESNSTVADTSCPWKRNWESAIPSTPYKPRE